MKTGLLQPADDSRPGVYIRNEDAIVFAADLRDVLRDCATLISWQDRKRVEQLVELLEQVKQ